MADPRGLPHNWETERALLGGLLLDPSQVPIVANVLGLGDFARPQHAAIFRVLLAGAERGIGVDVIGLLDEAERSGDFERYGGAAYVVALPQACSTVGHLESYAQRIRDHAVRRRLALLADGMREQLDEGAETPAVLDYADGTLREIGTVARAARPMATAAEMADATIEAARLMAEDPRDITGLDTGFAGWNRWFRGLQRGHVYALGGRPKMGKTSHTDAVLVQVARRNKVTCGFASMEMSREDLGRRRLASMSGVTLDRIATGKLEGDDWRRLNEAGDDLAMLSILTDDRGGLSASQIRMHWRSVARDRTDLACLAVDYLQRMASPDPRWDLRRSVAYNSEAIAALADELGVAILLLSQLSRGVESRSDKRPGPSDFLESGRIEADADAILTVYRDEVYNPESADKGLAEIACCANRNGVTGREKMAFLPDTQRWMNYVGVEAGGYY